MIEAVLDLNSIVLTRYHYKVRNLSVENGEAGRGLDASYLVFNKPSIARAGEKKRTIGVRNNYVRFFICPQTDMVVADEVRPFPLVRRWHLQ